mgnify:CR=1 FL=1
MDPVRILVVDDDEDVLVAARLLLKQHDYVVQTETDPGLIPAILKDTPPDVVLLDMNFTQDAASGREGFYWLQQIIAQDPAAVVVLATAYGDVEMAVRAIKEGAVDFVLKPWQNERLLVTLSAALELRRSRREANSMRSRSQQLSADLDKPFVDIIGNAPVMQEVFGTIAKVAATDASVLVLGENGSGKELVAREIHRRRFALDLFLILNGCGDGSNQTQSGRLLMGTLSDTASATCIPAQEIGIKKFAELRRSRTIEINLQLQ